MLRHKTSYNEFLAHCSITYEAQGAVKAQRYGQIYFNTLLSIQPEIAEKLRGSVNDPFYRDSVPPHVHQLVEADWKII